MAPRLRRTIIKRRVDIWNFSRAPAIKFRAPGLKAYPTRRRCTSADRRARKCSRVPPIAICSNRRPATLKVTLSGVSSESVTVKWATADGTAAAPSDYAAASGTLTFAPGESSQTINVLINGDTINEPDEMAFVNLSSPSNATIGKAQGTITILNDDAMPQLSISDVSVKEGNSGTTSATLTVQLTGPSSQTVSVKWTTADGTATAPSDYVPGGGTLTFPHGWLSLPLAVLM